jgi:hypothetical protein
MVFPVTKAMGTFCGDGRANEKAQYLNRGSDFSSIKNSDKVNNIFI